MLAKVAIVAVRGYQLTIGRLLPPRCRFAPSCSEYAIEALRVNGFVKGFLQSCWRLLRCAPWSKGGWDPVRELPAGPIRRVRRRIVTHG